MTPDGAGGLQRILQQEYAGGQLASGVPVGRGVLRGRGEEQQAAECEELQHGGVSQGAGVGVLGELESACFESRPVIRWRCIRVR